MFNVVQKSACMQSLAAVSSNDTMDYAGHVWQHDTKKWGSVYIGVIWDPHCQRVWGLGPQNPHRIAAAASVFVYIYIHKSFIKKMTQRINLTMKKWTECNETTHFERRNIKT